jgi:hypothetical protein
VTELDPAVEEHLASMSAEDFDALIARTRPPEEPANPTERAAAALRRSRGLDRTRKATPEQAAAAIRQYRR